MKSLAATALFAASLALSGSALAQHNHDHAAPAQTQGQNHRAIGVVKSVNSAKGTVTIQHEPVVTLKWPAMTMAFKPVDRKVFDELKAGREVNFEFEQRGKDYVITAVGPAWGSCTADCPMNKK